MIWLLGVVLRAIGSVECWRWLLGVELVGDRLSSAASSMVSDRLSSAAYSVDGSFGCLRKASTESDGSFGLLRNDRCYARRLRNDRCYARCLRGGDRCYARRLRGDRLLLRRADFVAVAARLPNPSVVPSPDRTLRRPNQMKLAVALDATPMLGPMPATWQAMIGCFVLPGRSQLASWLLSCYSLAGLQRSLPSRDSRCCLQPVHHGCRKRGGLVALFLACVFV